MACPKLLILGIALVSLGVVIHVVGIATPYWTELKLQNKTMVYGLFETCINGSCSSSTKDERDVDKAVQAMALLGLISSFLAVVGATIFTCVAYCGRNANKAFRVGAGVLSIFGFVFLVICIVTYAGKIFEDFRDEPTAEDTRLGYSFGLSSGGGVLMFIGGLLILCTREFEVEQYTNIS